MNREKLLELYKKYEFTKRDVYKHQHYVIITRQGIEKIQAKENHYYNLEVVNVKLTLQYLKQTAYLSAKA